MGATPDETNELIAVQDGYRESEQSWTTLRMDRKSRGLKVDPKLAIADGALGFWAAARKIWSTTHEQRCGVHKMANVLDKLPKRQQPTVKCMRHDIWQAETQAEAECAFDRFLQTHETKYPKVTGCLTKDRIELLTFYDFPAAHWIHLRTTNPIKSTFATVRLRHRKTKGNGSRRACLAMVFKLVESAQKRWRRLNGHELIQEGIVGVKFTNGLKSKAA